MITSSRNQKIQWVRSLQAQARIRRKEKAFVVEGVRLVEEALSAGRLPSLVLFTHEVSSRGHKLLEGLPAGSDVDEVTPTVFKAASDTKSPQGIMGVFPINPLPIPGILDLLFIPDKLRDPGNLGVILRTASSAGVQAVFIPPGTVDPYSPKVVRAAMGAHFRVPIHLMSWQSIQTKIREFNLHTYLAEASIGENYLQVNFRQPMALIIGGEAEGAGEEAHAMASTMVHIPLPGGNESLNAASAAAILLFEIVRQRSLVPD